MAEHSNTAPTSSTDPLVGQLGRSFDAVGTLIAKVRPDQWSAPTPCTDWTVRQLVDHLIGMNRVFTALLAYEPAPGSSAVVSRFGRSARTATRPVRVHQFSTGT